MKDERHLPRLATAPNPKTRTLPALEDLSFCIDDVERTLNIPHSTKSSLNARDDPALPYITNDEPQRKKKEETKQDGTPKTERTLAGRKPIRAIMHDLQKRIQHLKNNPADWEALQKRVAKAHERHTQDVGEQDIVKRNIKTAWGLHPSKLKHQDQLENARTTQKDKDGMGKIQNLQVKWFVIIAVAARVHYIEQHLKMVRLTRELKSREYRAAVTIQRSYRAHLKRKEEAQRRTALRAISQLMSITLPRWRAKRKTRASNVIMSFFREVYDVSKLMKIVKKYRWSVIKAQGYVRRFLGVRHAQVQAVGLYWDKLEPLWWAQKGKDANLDEDDRKKKKKKKKEEPTLKAITENLISRQKQFRIAQLEKGPNELEMKKRILFAESTEKKISDRPLLPTSAVMFGLMEQAFLESKNFS
ncbi:hypothetical protein EDD86DRAFT_245929 [Gorgonomyces haynaldii]|nr:hypothetical protein EDD86DRAFT_245929 [Gorgonomyces haynaldii]